MPGIGEFRRVATGLGSRSIAKFAAYDIQSAVATTGTAAGGSNQIKTQAMMTHVTVSVTTDLNDIVILPDPVVGMIVILSNGTTGYELRSSAPATIGINGGTGASAESAIPASTTAWLICETATAWKGFQSHGTGGTLALVEVAA